jgi:outer membrane lipoprotein carrier protein
MTNRFAAVVLATALCAVALDAAAGGVDRLHAFIERTLSARGEFTQQVTDRSGKPGEQSDGALQFQRPGRFRWEYKRPYKQLLVGDGAKLWMYDSDLNQVTVKTQRDALGATPASLLAGSNDIDRDFALSDGGTKDGLEWLVATPKDPDSTISRIRMGFRKDLPAAMELTDTFGQVTSIRFAKLESNPRLDGEQFKFTPPAGADVIAQ